MYKYLLLSILLTGCSWIDPSNEQRVGEYQVRGLSALVNGGSEGIRLVNEGQSDGCLEWRGEKGSYRSPGCAQMPATVTTTTVTTVPIEQ